MSAFDAYNDLELADTQEAERLRKRTRTRCRYCGDWTRSTIGVCLAHTDLPRLDHGPLERSTGGRQGRVNEPQKHTLQHMTRGQRIAFEHAVAYRDARRARIIWGHAQETCRALCDSIPGQAGEASSSAVVSRKETPAGRPITSVNSDVADHHAERTTDEQ